MDGIIAEFAVSMQQSADEAMQRLHCNDECGVCVWVLWVLWVREGVRVDCPAAWRGNHSRHVLRCILPSW